MYRPDEDDIVEHGGWPFRMPQWARRPRWLPALDWRPSRGAVILGVAGLLIGLVAGYALGYRQLGSAVRASQTAGTGAVPSAVPSSAAPSGLPGSAAGSWAYSSGLSFAGLSGAELAQTGEVCSVQHGQELQVGVQVISFSGSSVILGQIKPILPLGGLRAVSEQWADCGAMSRSWQLGGQGNSVIIQASTGGVEPGGVPPEDTVLPGGTAWLSVTFRVLVACPHPLPVQFSVSYKESGQTDTTTHLAGFPDLGEVPYTGCKGG